MIVNLSDFSGRADSSTGLSKHPADSNLFHVLVKVLTKQPLIFLFSKSKAYFLSSFHFPASDILGLFSQLYQSQNEEISPPPGRNRESKYFTQITIYQKLFASTNITMFYQQKRPIYSTLIFLLTISNRLGEKASYICFYCD